jgi:hypothetical protein
MALQISQYMTCTISRNQIKNWVVIMSIAISSFYVILSYNEDVTAQSTTTADNEFMNKFIGLTNVRCVNKSYQHS